MKPECPSPRYHGRSTRYHNGSGCGGGNEELLRRFLMLRAVAVCLALVVLVLGEAACTHAGDVASAPPTPLAAVAPLPVRQPPPWIISVAPQNQAESRSPISILFRAEVIP